MVSARLGRLRLRALGALLVLPALVSAATTLNVTITKNTTVDIPITLGGGYMWEDINHSGDGGLYGELLQNRAFQVVTPGTTDALDSWISNGTDIAVVNNTDGVSSALPNSLQVTVPSNVTGSVGFANTGYWGIKVRADWTYNASFWVKASGNYNSSISVSLRSNTTNATLAFNSTAMLSTPVTISSQWQKLNFTLKPLSNATDVNNTFVITIDDAAAAQDTTFYFGMFSLFPPTYKGRENGMRIDLAETMAATKPSVWRFPGGNNLEGIDPSQRWKWNETIGPLENRPGRMGDWYYVNTDGLGLIEYLNWAEDLNATVILDVWDGISLGDNNYDDLDGWPVVPEDQLQPYIDDVIHEIQFITDAANASEWGALRAQYGRTEPYALRYVEIGNEDMFQQASYAAYRWNMFVTQLGAKFPDLVYIATSLPSLTLDPPAYYIDYHVYNSTDWFLNNTFMFDDYPRNGTQFFVGEYAVISEHNPDPSLDEKLLYPTLEAAVAEAAYMTGMERNADVVFAAAYAPSLQNMDGYQANPNLISYDAGSLVKSASYYAQEMFSVYRGTQVLQTVPTSSTSTAPLYWVASHNNATGDVIVKFVNSGTDLVQTTFTFALETNLVNYGVTGTLVQLAPGADGLYDVYNTLNSPNVIVPKTSTFDFGEGACTDSGCVLEMVFPPMSVNVLVMNVPN